MATTVCDIVRDTETISFCGLCSTDYNPAGGDKLPAGCPDLYPLCGVVASMANSQSLVDHGKLSFFNVFADDITQDLNRQYISNGELGVGNGAATLAALYPGVPAADIAAIPWTRLQTCRRPAGSTSDNPFYTRTDLEFMGAPANPSYLIGGTFLQGKIFKTSPGAVLGKVSAVDMLPASTFMNPDLFVVFIILITVLTFIVTLVAAKRHALALAALAAPTAALAEPKK